MKESNRLRRLATEFVVIVVGVFIAVGAESWWSEREERRYERELREDMVTEFEANLRIVEADLATNDTAHARAVGFASQDDRELQSAPSDQITAEIGSWANWAGFDPEMGSAQALVESGNVGAISDRRLRLLLSRWAGLLEEKRRFNLQAVEFQQREVYPVIASAAADEVWDPEERREVRALLRVFVVLQASVIRNQGALREAAREILDYLGE